MKELIPTKQMQNPTQSYYTLISAPSYFTTPERSSIISEEELNF